MGVNAIKGDLHTHTHLSDGSCSIERLFQLAKNTGLDYISITDHDHISDKDRDNELSKKYCVKSIDGVEISAKDFGRNRRVHILCYMPNKTDELREICKRITDNRVSAGLKMAKLAADKYPITAHDIQNNAIHSDCIFKQHIMQTLISAGFATQIFGELFHELFDFKTGSCMVEHEHVDVYEVLGAVKRSGGICVMAHPYTYNSLDFLNEILDKGYLDGIEVWSSKSSLEQESVLLDICKKHNLIPTGGSDFHGAHSSRICPIGIKTTPKESIEAMFCLKNLR
ncbi:MAG: PHP domain-containing protein [Oscillospiraceae bacterium]